MIVGYPVSLGVATGAKSLYSVLVIDDESQIRRFVKLGLELQGYAVSSVDTGTAGLEAALQILPDVIILDLALPDMSGIEVLQSIRMWSDVPVIVLSIESAEDTKVLLLRLGADDYIVKPFGIAEPRCEAALRRSYKSPDKDPIVRTGPLTYDLISRSVTVGNLLIALTPKELQLLHVLASHLACCHAPAANREDLKRGSGWQRRFSSLACSGIAPED